MNSPVLEGLLWQLMAFAQKRRVVTVLFWTLMTSLALWRVATGLSINTDSSDMISASAPYRVAAASLNAAFPNLNDQVLIVVDAPTQDEATAFTESLATRLAGRDEVNSVFAPPAEPFFKENGLLFLEIEELETLLARLTSAAPLIERLGPDPTATILFDALAEAAEQDSDVGADQETLDNLYRSLAEVLTTDDTVLSWQALLSPDTPETGRVLFTLDPVLDFTKLKPAKAVKNAILEEAAAIRAEGILDAAVMITGDPVLRTEELEAVSTGIGWALGLSGLMVAGLLAFAFRSTRLVIGCLVSIALSVIMTAGVAVALFGELNLISVAFAVLMVGLGADFAIHLLIHVRHEAAHGHSRRASLYRTARTIGTALILTAPTTALAFFSFAPTEFIGMNQLGVIAGLGVLIAFLVAMTLLPAMMSLFESKAAPAQIEAVSRTGWLAQIVTPMGVLVGGLGLASLFLLPQARFDADPMALRAKTAPSVIAFNAVIEEEGATPYRLNVLAGSREELLARAERLKTPESVDSTRHLLSFVPEDQDLKLSLIDAAAVGLGFALISGGEVAMDDDPMILPSTTTRLMAALEKEHSADAKGLLEVLDRVGADDIQAAEPRIFKFWPQQRQALNDQLRANFVAVADVPQQLQKRYITDDGTYRLEVLPVGGGVELEERRRFVNDVLALAPDAAGSARTALSAGDIIGRAMVQASVTAAVLVSLLVFFIVRSWRLLVVLIIPLILAGSLTTATGTLFGLPYNFANVLVLPLIIGIGIDSGLHLAMRAERSGNALDAVRGPTGRAVVFSALTTIASFGSLVVSDHRGTSSMGALLTIGMVWVLATMLFVLPPLAELLYGRRTRTQED